MSQDSRGNLASTYKYDSFGNLTALTGSIFNPVRFTSREFDVETGLYFYRARYYDATIGRFLSEDPVTFLGGHNFYAYVANNPVNRRDPLGLTWLEFDSCSNTLFVHPGTSDTQGPPEAFPAGNNTASNSNGPWPSGTYLYSYYVPHPEIDATGPYGSYGNFVFDVPGRPGMGVHSGRSGPESPTMGCIRTTDECTSRIRDLNAHDPLTHIIVR